MTIGYENIFPISKEEEYICFLQAYNRGHSGMYIELDHSTEESFYLYFAGVRYFSGTLTWKGVGFRLATDIDLKSFSRLPEQSLLHGMQIFVVNSPALEVIIIAGEVQKVDHSDYKA